VIGGVHQRFIEYAGGEDSLVVNLNRVGVFLVRVHLNLPIREAWFGRALSVLLHHLFSTQLDARHCCLGRSAAMLSHHVTQASVRLYLSAVRVTSQKD
jgi:hypothetical protein